MKSTAKRYFKIDTLGKKKRHVAEVIPWTEKQLAMNYDYLWLVRKAKQDKASGKARCPG